MNSKLKKLIFLVFMVNLGNPLMSAKPTFFIFFYSSMNGSQNISSIEQFVIDFVIRLRKQNNFTQEDMATILNVSRTFITNVESAKNRSKYNLNHIEKLADHFGISPREFLPIDCIQVSDR